MYRLAQPLECLAGVGEAGGDACSQGPRFGRSLQPVVEPFDLRRTVHTLTDSVGHILDLMPRRGVGKRHILGLPAQGMQQIAGDLPGRRRTVYCRPARSCFDLRSKLLVLHQAVLSEGHGLWATNFRASLKTCFWEASYGFSGSHDLGLLRTSAGVPKMGAEIPTPCT